METLSNVETLSNTDPFYIYWNQMVIASQKDDAEYFVQLEDISFIDRNNNVHTVQGFGLRTLYVRKSYRDLAQFILGNTTLRNAVLTGTPGVGKTTFRNYLVLRLIKHYRAKEQDFSIVLDISPREEGGVCQAFFAKFNNGEMTWTAQTHRDNPFGTAQPKENTWLLLDVSEGNSQARYRNAGHTVMFSSPIESAWKNFLKEEAVLLYLPTWSYDEANAMRTEMNLDEHIFLDRWNKYKGIARALFATDDQYNGYQRSVESSFENVNIQTAFVEMEKACNNFAMKHMIFYYEVEEGYMNAHMQWGSDYLKGNAMAKYSDRISVDLAGVLDDLSGCTPGSLKGLLLEPMALKFLSTCDVPFQCEMLVGSGLNSHITFPVLSMKGNLSDDEFMEALKNEMKIESAENVLLVPSNHCYPAIDAAAIVTREGFRFCFLIQVTINKHHGVRGKKASALLQQMVRVVGGVDRCVFVFVLPDNKVFTKFEAQDIPDCDDAILRQCKIALSSSKRRRTTNS